jgi:thiosulfate/3-mercaptopyruvate sulfurtransferase
MSSAMKPRSAGPSPETASGVLVSTDWVAAHLNSRAVRIVEVDVDTRSYSEGHVPGATGWNWTTQLCDTLRRDILSRAQLEMLLGEAGIEPSSTVVLYGDNNNWFAAWAFWQLAIYGHKDIRIMNGGRKKWLEEGRANLIDVRSPQEFSGEILAPPGLPETCQRGGHIPGAVNIPWGKACNDDGTFRSRAELEELYRGLGIRPDQPVITYCRIGERSSHTWFVLRHLLDYPRVKNYDGSWTEWGNLVGMPVERAVHQIVTPHCS